MSMTAHLGLQAEAAKVVSAIVDPVKECALRWPTFRFELHPRYHKTVGKARTLAGWVVRGRREEGGEELWSARHVGVFFGNEEGDARREIAVEMLLAAERERIATETG